MDLLKLECFCKVVDTGNFYTAAEELNMSQSSVSKHILQMEKELGVQLLNRNTNHTRKVTLTSAGEVVYPDFCRILSCWKEAEKKISGFRPRQEIRVGCVDHLQKVGGLTPIISFMKENPDIPLAMIQDGTRQLLDKLLKKEVDAAIIAHIYSSAIPAGNLKEFPEEEYVRLLMAKDDYDLAVNPDHPLAAYKKIDWDALNGQKLIILDKSFSSNWIIRETLDYHGCRSEIAFEPKGVDYIWGMVLENYGVSLLSRKIIRQMKGVVSIRMEDPIHRDTVLLAPKKASKAVQKFVKKISDMV